LQSAYEDILAMRFALRCSSIRAESRRAARWLRPVTGLLAMAIFGVSVANAAAPPTYYCKMQFAAVYVGGGITITERDGSSVSGILTSAHGDVAEITPTDSKQAVTVPCADVASILHGPMDPVKLKQMLLKRGIGKRIEVLELGDRGVMGKLTAIQNDGFEITPDGRGAQAVSIPYPEVTFVENYSRVGSTGNGAAGALFIALPFLAITIIVLGIVELAH
jgi:hypothetical protein